MGFTSQDDLINKMTSGNFQRTDWNKQTGAAAYTAGRWYDLGQINGTPPAGNYGDITINGSWLGSLYNWTPNGTGWNWGAGNVCLKTSGTGTTLSSNVHDVALVPGRYYRVQYTLSLWTSGTCTISLGGTAGSGRASAATFIEIIQAGATQNIIFTASVNTAVFTITGLSIVEWGGPTAATPSSQIMSDTINRCNLYTGPDVAPLTKHIVNMSAVTAVATGVPGVFMLVDLLMVYPYIDAATNTPQVLNNAWRALSRYVNGEGVRAFLVAATTLGAVAQNVTMSYTNQDGTSGRSLPITVSTTASAIVPHIAHSGLAANNYGPFLPLATSDTGIRSVENITFSAAGTANTFYHLVLCRPITTLPIVAASVASERDLLNQLPSLPRVYDDACLSFLFFSGGAVAAATNWYGSVEFAWG